MYLADHQFVNAIKRISRKANHGFNLIPSQVIDEDPNSREACICYTLPINGSPKLFLTWVNFVSLWVLYWLYCFSCSFRHFFERVLDFRLKCGCVQIVWDCVFRRTNYSIWVCMLLKWNFYAAKGWMGVLISVILSSLIDTMSTTLGLSVSFPSHLLWLFPELW